MNLAEVFLTRGGRVAGSAGDSSCRSKSTVDGVPFVRSAGLAVVVCDGAEVDTTGCSGGCRSNFAELLRTCPKATGFLRGGDFEDEWEGELCVEVEIGGVVESTMACVEGGNGCEASRAR